MEKFSKYTLFKKVFLTFLKKRWKSLTSTVGAIAGAIAFSATLGLETPEIFGIKHFYLWLTLLLSSILIFLYFIWKDNPFSHLRKIEEGKVLTLNEIKQLSLIPRVVIIGLSDVGKTTLIKSFFNERFSTNRTQQIEGRIKLHKGEFFCFIDISGEQNIHAFQVLNYANFIILMVDHSKSNISKKILNDRQDETGDYIKRVKENIQGNWDTSTIKNIPSLFLVNKKDLWQTANKTKIDILQSNYHGIFDEWKNISPESEYIEYSNKSDCTLDISPADILDKISKGLK